MDDGELPPIGPDILLGAARIALRAGDCGSLDGQSPARDSPPQHCQEDYLAPTF